MNAHTFTLPLFTVALLAGPALTQELTGQQDKKQEKKKSADQDQKKAGEGATQDKPIVDTTKLLKRSLDKAKTERDFLKKVHDDGGLLRRFKMRRKNALDMKRKFKPEIAGPAMPTKKKARLLGDGEKAELDKTVVFAVESAPVTQAEFDAMLAYIRSYPQKDGVAMPETAAIQALIEQKAPQGIFKEGAYGARSIMEEIKKRLDGGAKFGDLANQFSQDKVSGKNGGKLDFLVRNSMDVSFAQRAFGTKIGQVSGVFAAADGYHIVRTLSVKKGETPDLDRVKTAHIVRYYTGDAKRRAAVTQRVLTGNVDIAFRTDAMRKLVPETFK